MNKKVIFFFIFILAMLGYIFKFDKIIDIQFINLTNNIKSSYKSYVEDLSKTYNKYFDQEKIITKLQNDKNNNKNFKLLYQLTKTKLDNIKNINFMHRNNNWVKYVKVLSYKKLNDYSKVILDTNITNINKIYALSTIDGYSAGIVINEDNQNIAYLNPNEKCNYAVYIGNIKAPGITSGYNENNEMIIKYIPKQFKININDKVITSGMDGIFPEGLKLGVVTNITAYSNTKSVYVKPYKKVLNKKYFYIIK